jgi:hypothetical protein
MPNTLGAAKAPTTVAQTALLFLRNDRRLKGQHVQGDGQFMAFEVSFGFIVEAGFDRGFFSSMSNRA